MRLQPQSFGAPTWRFASFHLRFLELLDDRPRCDPVAHLRPRVVISARLVNAQRAHALAMCIRKAPIFMKLYGLEVRLNKPACHSINGRV
jgi:hypothetical protein